MTFKPSDVDPHHFDAAPGTNFDAAPAPTLLFTKSIFLEQTKVNIKVRAIFFGLKIVM
jgi:hypothetical protein